MNTCARCPEQWTGLAPAHCSGCHQTFAIVALFDLHRSSTGEHGGCQPPETVKNMRGERVLFHRNGMWRTREMTAEEKKRAFGGAK